MVDILKEQYKLITSSRAVVLNFMEAELGHAINTPIYAFGGRPIRYLLVHNPNTYLHWLYNFAMGNTMDFFDDEKFNTIADIRSLYTNTDDLVNNFLIKFEDKLNEPISGILSRNRKVTATPLELFTHVTTHEFHHKGQMMTMCRLLGYPPPDTDIIRF